MRLFHISLLLLGLLLFTSCNEKKPVIVFDDWWNIDFTKSGCLGKDDNYCVDNSLMSLDNFESKLETAFASDNVCEGILVLRPKARRYKNIDNIMSQEHWGLTVNFHSDKSSQNWMILRNTDNKVFKGEGNPTEIAHIICAILRNKGAEL